MVDDAPPLRVTFLEAENVKRLRALRFTPPVAPGLVCVGGRNGQGKSSALDSILYALAGAGRLPGDPVRHGAEEAKIRVDLGGTDGLALTIERRIRPDRKTELVVRDARGAAQKSPQRLLDALGDVGFDPQEFERLEPRQRLDVLRRLVGLDTSDLDAAREAAYSERTIVGREIKRAEAAIAGRRHDLALPVQPIDGAHLARQLEAHRAADVVRTRATARREQARAALVEAEERVAIARAAMAQAQEAEAAALFDAPDGDPAELTAELQRLGERNRMIAENNALLVRRRELEEHRRVSEALTARIAELDTAKQARIAAVKMPVPGLALGADDVTLGGVPFEQASSAEKLAAGVAIGLALNPRLRIMRVRDGSLLDAEHLEMLRRLAEQANAWVWVERVGAGAECALVIEDGEAVIP